MRRPIIGITAALETASWVIWHDTEVNLSQRNYSETVSKAGGIPVLLPAHDESAADPSDLLDVLDALVLSGGADLDPASYGEEPHPRTVGYKAERDRFELALCRGAIERDMPLFGICRGLQLLNVACDGTLEQHLGDGTQHVETPGTFSTHEVRIEPGSLTERVVGTGLAEVRSHHHQAVGQMGAGLTASAWSVPDDLVEGVELEGHPFALGVMWHPEEVRDAAPFEALVEAAKQGVAA